MKTNLKIILVFAALLFAAFTFTSCSKDEDDDLKKSTPVPKYTITPDSLIGTWIAFGNGFRKFSKDEMIESRGNPTPNYHTKSSYFITINNDIIFTKTHHLTFPSVDWIAFNSISYDTMFNVIISNDTLYEQIISKGILVKSFQGKRQK